MISSINVIIFKIRRNAPTASAAGNMFLLQRNVVSPSTFSGTQVSLTSFLSSHREGVVLFHQRPPHPPEESHCSFSLLLGPSGEAGSYCLLGLPGRPLELASPCQRDTRNGLNQAQNASKQVWGPPGMAKNSWVL